MNIKSDIVHFNLNNITNNNLVNIFSVSDIFRYNIFRVSEAT